MQVRRHGVPDAARLEHRQPEQQLRGLAGRRHDVLVDGALVGCLQRAALQRHGLVDRDVHGFEARVRRRRDQIELRGFAGRADSNTTSFVPIGTYRPSLRRERRRPVPSSVTVPAVLPTLIDAELAPLQERLALGADAGSVWSGRRSACAGAMAPPITKRS